MTASVVIKKLAPSEINAVLYLSESHTHSFIALQSFFGYSQSELEIDVQSKEYGYYAISVDAQVVCVFYIFNINSENHNAQFQILGAIEGHQNFVLDFISQIMNKTEIYKFYSFLRKNELKERQSLIALGFQHEGCLKEHYYVNGHYEDLEVYGLLGDKNDFKN